MARFYFILVVILPFASALPVTDTKGLLSEAVTTIQKALKFFSSDYSSINVDGLFGLRLGQGQLIEAANVCSKKAACESYLEPLKSLNDGLDDTCNKALPYLEQSDPDYYKRFVETISKPYMLPYTATKFNKKLLASRKSGSNSNYDEDKGDACYARIMGTYYEKDTGVQTPRCNITDQCLKMMTSTGTSRYAITHQLLYFMVIEHVGCTEQVEKFIEGKKVFDIQKQFCQKIYTEADTLVRNGQVKPSHRDLFLEQSVLCGSLGFEDFFRSDWEAMTLRWPDKKEGCMKSTMPEMLEEMAGNFITDAEKNPNGVKNFVGNLKGNFKNVPQALETAAGGLIAELKKHPEEAKNFAGKIGEKFEDELKKLSGSKTMRKLLREKSMKDGCMAHASGLAFGTFGSYVHYLVQQL